MEQATIEKRVTPIGKSYWGDSGAYQEEHDKLYKNMVAVVGESHTINGELLRIVNRFYYDYCNNGNCNCVEREMIEEETYEDCNECDGHGEFEEYDDDGELTTFICDSCGGTGELIGYDEYAGDIKMNGYWDNMLEFLRAHAIEKDKVKALEKFLLKQGDNCTFTDEQMHIYDELTDAIIYQILTTEDKPYLVYGAECWSGGKVRERMEELGDMVFDRLTDAKNIFNKDDRIE